RELLQFIPLMAETLPRMQDLKSDANLTKRNNGVYTFRVQGQVYHFINDLVPENDNAKNLQLYFHDTEHELENRLASSDRLSKYATEICMKALEKKSLCLFLLKPERPVWVDGEENGEQSHRNIEVKIHSNQSRKIEYYYGCYDALQYPLMFPFGELGWHQGILKRGEKEYKIRGKAKPSAANLISPQNAVNVEDLLFQEYYAYKLQIRKNDKSCLLYFARLLQQYIVDNYVKLETQRLDFFRLQQQEIRKELLQGVVDAMAIGEICWLSEPSTSFSFSLPSTSDSSSYSSIKRSQPCRRFHLHEIQLATKSFDETLVVGIGSFGKVYKGKIFDGSNLVVAAIKRLDSKSNPGAAEFWP
ncbi:uncharacterized protein Tco_1458133, partial [Tanacetum coccineum]